MSWSHLAGPWPDPASLGDIPGVAVTWPSSSPFAPEHIGAGPEDDPPTAAHGRLYLPPVGLQPTDSIRGQHAARSVPAVVLLHGSGGILPTRELTYAPQLARMGVAALVVDSFGARRERGTAFIDRLLNITETMMLADAYAGLAFLAAWPEIDPRRVVLTGFSYGAMAATYGIYAQVADKLAPGGLRFAGHVAFYGPCIARFADSRTTGAPLLMLLGGADEITDQGRCAEIAADLRAGGSRAETIVYPGAVHQWDGGFGRRASAAISAAARSWSSATARSATWYRAGDDRPDLAQDHPRPVHDIGRTLPDRPRRQRPGPGERRLGTSSWPKSSRVRAGRDREAAVVAGRPRSHAGRVDAEGQHS